MVVQEVYPEGLIAQDGRLQPGDQIIEINGVDMTCSTHGQVSTTVQRQAHRGRERVIKFGSIREEIGLNLAAEAVAVPLSFSPPHPGQIHRSLLSVSQYHYCSSAASLSLMGV